MATYDQPRPELNLRRFWPLIILVIALILLLAFWGRMFVNVGGGEAGVLFRTFGGGIDTKTTFGEGFHLVAPWNRMHKYELRMQEREEKMNVLSSDGLEIEVEVSVQFKPVYGELGKLHQKVGTEYADRFVIPMVRSATREVVGRYSPEEIYSTKRGAIQTEIEQDARGRLAEKHVDLERILIRSIMLPEKIKKAIEDKKEQEQLALAYEFRLQSAEKEAERMRIQAEGQARANNIINSSLSPNILRDKGIDATKELAKSPNTKVVVIGSGADGMPLILGGQ
jgi:regulator of protease activity HflC (stomatin/prohibitin superfamily)